jgi:phage terminase large subunit-like protein
MDPQELAKLKAEYARQLEQEALRLYRPHEKQEAFHRSQASKRGLFGGNQSGKSYAGAMEIAWTVGKVHPWRSNKTGRIFGRDCCVDFGVMKSVIIPTYQGILPRKEAKLSGKTFEGKPRIWPGLKGGTWQSAWSSEERSIYLEDGSFIEVKSYEQGRTNRDTFAGPPRDIIRMDEEPPQVLYNENIMRQVTTGQNLLFTMTPLNYSMWLYSGIFEAASRDPNIDVFQMASKDNPHADSELLKMMAADISDPIERAARLYGEFTYAQGRVWKEYGDHNLIDAAPIPRDWHRSIVIDPHSEKPTAVNWYAEDHRGNIYCYREGDYKGDVEHICDQIKIQCGGEYIDMILIDPSSRQSAAIHGKGSLVDEFRKYFPGVIEANNNREIGWDVVRKMVRNTPTGPKFFVMRCCPVTDFQMRNYSWKPPTKTGESRNKPEVVKHNEDHCDTTRYRCMAQYARGQEDFTGFNLGVYAN